ncbi:hypothetical protein [Streptomyces carpinensis]|uniref:HNH nuclease domain-containing protein n=1 Tax=Streptomyces carpinensis TaxID=66369 RepID=A0ABV1W4Z8_9ACTN|nr:hypothetical protein [Streptomyces carpinensis]
MVQGTCAVVFADGTTCGKGVKYKRDVWCHSCKEWSRNNGGADPNGRQPRRTAAEIRRILQRGIDAGPEACVVFGDGTTDACVSFGGESMKATRAVWLMANREVPVGGRIMRTCERYGCINLHHIRLQHHTIERFCVVVMADERLCGKPVSESRKDWCAGCRAWSNKHGGADPSVRKRWVDIEARRRQMEAAAYATTTECIVLEGFAERPTVMYEGVHMMAARAVWIIRHGDPGDHDVLHRCNNGSGAHGCINISHLKLGDHTENMRDRNVTESFHSILTGEQAREIRERWVPGVDLLFRGNTRQLAEEYGVSVQTIREVGRGASWKHLHN